MLFSHLETANSLFRRARWTGINAQRRQSPGRILLVQRTDTFPSSKRMPHSRAKSGPRSNIRFPLHLREFSLPKQHLERFRRFCTVHPCTQHSDTHTHHIIRATSTASKFPHLYSCVRSTRPSLSYRRHHLLYPVIYSSVLIIGHSGATKEI